MKSLILKREGGQLTNETILVKQLNTICNEAIERAKAACIFKLVKHEQQVEVAPYSWSYLIRFLPPNEQSEILIAEWVRLYSNISKLSSLSSRFGKYPWKIVGGDIPQRISVEDDNKDYGIFSLDRLYYFDHLFGLEPQINILYTALMELKHSELTNRFHCVCFGDPGVGKTDVLCSLGKMLGRENESYYNLDATSMTEAGVMQLLMDSQIIPPVLIIEEIEKAPENTMRFLLGLMDQRAQIKKTNFRIGHYCEHVRMLVMATVNDKDKFDRALSGALCSRFSYDIYFPKQSRDILLKILMREIDKIEGNPEWAEAALEFCVDNYVLDTYFKRDPRKIIPIAICGKDSLLDGTFQKQFMQILPPLIQTQVCEQDGISVKDFEELNRELAEEFKCPT